MSKQITLTIKKYWLEKIISGEKKEEYRDSKEYYHKLFKDFDTKTFHVSGIDTILLRAGYNLKTKDFELKEKNGILFESPKDKTNDKYCIIQVEKIVHEKFENFIPEGMNKNDLAYTIYIKSVLEHNM